MLVAYNALLHFLGSIGKLQRTLAFYSSMRRRGPTPDVVTYNTLISSTAARGNVRDAMLFFSDMVDAGEAVGVSICLKKGRRYHKNLPVQFMA